MPAQFDKIAARGHLASRILQKQLFALKVPKHHWVLVPKYKFARHALSSMTIVGIVGHINSTDAPWFELAVIRGAEYNSEIQEMVYTVVLVSRSNTISGERLREIKISAARIGCIFNNDKTRLPVTTG